MTKTGFQIVARRADGANQVYAIADGESLVVGRSQTKADFVLQDPAISRSHLRLECVDGQLYAENLSSHGVSLEGSEIHGRVEVKPGQTLMLGKNTRLSFAQADITPPSAGLDNRSAFAPERTIFDSDERTSEETNGPALGRPMAATAPDSASPSRLSFDPVPPSIDRLATDLKANSEWVPPSPIYNPGAFEGTIELGTMIRPITSALPQKKQAAGIEKIIIVAVVLAMFGILAMLFRPPPPKKALSWPVDQNGVYLDEKVASKSGFFSVIYPSTGKSERQVSESGFAVEYALDRIPFRLWYNEINLGEHAFADGNSVEVLWKDILPGKENWIFEKSLELPIFIGEEQGIPLTVMQYYRTGAEGKIMGVAQLIRYGATLGSVCIEIPEKDQLRAEQLILNPYILVEPKMVQRHWQGDGKPLRRESADVLLKLAKHELTRDAPAIWEQVETLLLDTVRKAFAEQNQGVGQEALDLLASLRSRKTTWFHAMKLKKINFERQRNAELGKEIARQCQLVFSSPGDQRFYEVRNW